MLIASVIRFSNWKASSKFKCLHSTLTLHLKILRSTEKKKTPDSKHHLQCSTQISTVMLTFSSYPRKMQNGNFKRQYENDPLKRNLKSSGLSTRSLNSRLEVRNRC